MQGLVFKYLHFYGTYDYIGDSRKWYDHEVRIIKKRQNDTCPTEMRKGFRVGKTKLNVKPVDAYVYHYGWVKARSP